MVRFSDLKNISANRNGKEKGSGGAGAGKAPVSSAMANAAPLVESAAKGTDVYQDAVFYLKKVFGAVKEGKKFPLDPAFQVVRQMVGSGSSQDTLFVHAIQLDDRQNFLVNKCVNVSVYSVRAAEQLGYSRDRQVEIGVAALFHAVGMCRIPEGILNKKTQLTQAELETIQKHPEAGYEILKPYSGSYPYLAEVALQVHERIDGSGYPRGLRGDEIHEYAQIIGLMGIYEALSHSRPQRDRFSHFYAIKEIIKTCKPKFHKKHLKALINTLSIFPLATHVRLNSNAVGRVIETYAGQPMRPRLQIEYDSQGRKVLTDRVVNLPDHSLLYIVDSITADELAQLAEGRSLQASPRQFEDREPGPDPSDPDSSQSPPEIPRPAPKQRRHNSRGGARPLLLFLLLLLLLVGIPYWQGRQTVEPSSASHRAVEHARKIVPQEPKRTIQNPARPQSNEKKPVTSPIASPDTDTGLQHQDTVPTEAAAPTSETAREKAPPAELQKDIQLQSSSGIRNPYSILVGSYRSATSAERAMDQFRDKGLFPYRVKVDLGKDGIWHRIFFGHYKTLSEAQEAVANLHVKEAVVKYTRFASLVDYYPDRQQAATQMQRLLEMEYSPYTIAQEDGSFGLFVGAFYTQQGAQAQQAELLVRGVKSRVVER